MTVASNQTTFYSGYKSAHPELRRRMRLSFNYPPFDRAQGERSLRRGPEIDRSW